MTGRHRGGVVTMSRGDELAHCTAICHHLYWQRPSDSHHKMFVYHLYNVGPTSKTLSRHCINVIQIFCDCFAQTHNTCDISLWDYQKHCHDYGSLLGRCQGCWPSNGPHLDQLTVNWPPGPALSDHYFNFQSGRHHHQLRHHKIPPVTSHFRFRPAERRSPHLHFSLFDFISFIPSRVHIDKFSFYHMFLLGVMIVLPNNIVYWTLQLRNSYEKFTFPNFVIQLINIVFTMIYNL